MGKTNPTNLFNIKSDFQNSFNKLNSFFINDLSLNNSYTYGMDRQPNYTNISSTLPMSLTLMDNKSVNKFFSYNLSKNLNTLTTNRFNYETSLKSNNMLDENLVNTYQKLLPNNLNTLVSLDFDIFPKIPNISHILSAENDSKQYSNSFKYLLNLKTKKKNIQNFNYLLNDTYLGEYNTNVTNPSINFSNVLYNTENTLKFKDYKSSNAQFLGSERTVRLLSNINSNSYK